MKRLRIILLFVMAIAAISLSQPSVTRAQSSVNNFTIDDYQIDYYLDRDKDGRSTLKTVESITAMFPQSNQNHGIERAIPNTYDGHATGLHIDAGEDQTNQSKKYTTYTSGGNTVVRIGNADTYVHGRVTYKLTYSQRDVTKYFPNTGSDEFYWDTNGVDWRVPISALSVRLHLSENLAAVSSKGDGAACYSGAAGSAKQCEIEYANGIYTVSTYYLAPSENTTIAAKFPARTFAAYQQSLSERLAELAALYFTVSLIVTTPIAVALIAWFIVRYDRRSNRSAEITTIIPEYLPPADTSVSTAAAISRLPQRSFSAQLIDFAVRHYITISETRAKTWFRQSNYELEIIKDISSLKSEEQELLQDIFDNTQVGAKLDMASMKTNSSLAVKLADNPGLLDKSIAGTYGLRARDDLQSGWYKRAGFITLAFATVTLSPFLLAAAVVSFISGAVLKPLTDKGLQLSRYLKGLESYIKVAETERLRMLQSPEGAAKVGNSVDPKNPKQLVKLYERVLPYAVLFGQEKEWNKRLSDYYQTSGESPSWYHSNNTVFNAAVFSSAISNFNSAATYSNPSSSSSGGSGGGGSSGGGGGGGGGGGW